jgi:hypothetical protein
MPHERGGRLHLDPGSGRWRVSSGYEDHPAYWVTWIGAAAFATLVGARLPARAELDQLTESVDTGGNTAYSRGDASPVTEPGLGPDTVHQLLGNLKVWCADGPGGEISCGGPATRWLYGIAWNTPSSAGPASGPRSRHILGCSRSVGIRLVRDQTTAPVDTSELVRLLAAWISGLTVRSRPLAAIDGDLIRALGGSQADIGLGPHVAASTREPRNG